MTPNSSSKLCQTSGVNKQISSIKSLWKAPATISPFPLVSSSSSALYLSKSFDVCAAWCLKQVLIASPVLFSFLSWMGPPCTVLCWKSMFAVNAWPTRSSTSSQVWVALRWLTCYLFPHHNFCKFLLPVRELMISLHQHLSLYGHTVLRSAGWKARYWVEESSPGWGSASSLGFFLPVSLPTVLTGVPSPPRHCFPRDEAV